MPRKKKSKHEELRVARISSLYISEEDNIPCMEVITGEGNTHDYQCSLPLYKLLEKTNAHKNYRVDYNIFVNTDTNIVERITSDPKVEYKAYQVEYEEDIKLPKESLFTAP